MRRLQSGFYQAFLISMIACWSPSKALAYMAPLMALAWFVVATNSARIVLNSLALLAAGLAWIGFSALINPDFILQNALLTLITYSSFYLLVVIPSRRLAGDELYRRMLQAALAMVALQAVIGILQACYGAAVQGGFGGTNGDRVEGTIHPWPASAGSFANVMFATNMAYSLLFAVPYLPQLKGQRKQVAACGLGLLSLVLASVVHLLLFIAMAAAIAWALYRPVLPLSDRPTSSPARFRRGIPLAVGIALLPVLGLLILPRNITLLGPIYQMARRGRNPKLMVVQRVVTELPQDYPLAPLVGIGPGQFTSRASLVGTGLYFGGPFNPKPVPLLASLMSKAFRRYVFDLWIFLEMIPGASMGTSFDPFFSWISVYSEFGLLGIIGVGVLLIGTLLRVRKPAAPPEQKLFAFAFGSGAILLFLLGLQTNVWEVPQSILIGCLILKVLYSNALYGPGEGQVAVRVVSAGPG